MVFIKKSLETIDMKVTKPRNSPMTTTAEETVTEEIFNEVQKSRYRNMEETNLHIAVKERSDNKVAADKLWRRVE